MGMMQKYKARDAAKWSGGPANTGARSPETQRAKRLEKKHGITEAEYQAMLQGQQQLCAICSKPAGEDRSRYGGFRRLAVDHCHVTGIIRGLLCADCNNGLGLFRDNSEVLRRAALYIDTNQERILQLLGSERNSRC